MILVSNNPYQMDDLDGRGTRERIDLGVVGVVAARIGSAVDAEQFAALNAIGQLRRFRGWDEWTARRFQIDSDRPVEIGIVRGFIASGTSRTRSMINSPSWNEACFTWT